MPLSACAYWDGIGNWCTVLLQGAVPGVGVIDE